MKISAGRLAAMVCVGFFTTAMGCKEQGPLERAGEEIDEAVDTAKNGKESTATKLDDAADEVRDGAKDASKELKK